MLLHFILATRYAFSREGTAGIDFRVMGAILQPNSRHSKSAQDRGQVSTHTWDLGLLISHLLGYLWDLGTWDKVRLSQGSLENTWTVFFFFLKKTFIKCQPYSQLCSLLYGNVLKEEGTVLHYKCPASMIFCVCQYMRRIHIKHNQLYTKSSTNQSISR